MAACSSAYAGGAPALNVQWTLDGNPVLNEFPTGAPNGSGAYRYSGGLMSGGVDMSYDLIGLPNRRVSSDFVLVNTSGQTVEIELLVTLPFSDTIPDPSYLTGSVSLGLTANTDNGGAVEALAGIPFWQALIDGTAVGGMTDLLPNLSMVQPGFGSPPGQDDHFMDVLGPAVLSDIGILVTFSLTTDTQMSFTSVFNVVPAPGGLALFALSIVIRRRRRRAG